jgi:nucleoid DNA-binding protein
MRPHELELRADLASGKMSRKQLAGIMLGVLRAAKPVRRVARMGRNPATGSAVELHQTRIDERGVKASMKWKCRYLGWC